MQADFHESANKLTVDMFNIAEVFKIINNPARN